MKIGDLYTHSDNLYLVKSTHPNPKRIILLNLDTGKVFSVLKSIIRTGYTLAT
jgi:2-succinyl-5-enolpyruvyl-6-hydroxy-3-cyclohexene-1-carboxylate synthase